MRVYFICTCWDDLIVFGVLCVLQYVFMWNVCFAFIMFILCVINDFETQIKIKIKIQ